MLRALIVDDEIASIRSLEILLSQFCKQVDVVGTARSVDEALAQTTRLKPDLIFLDIEMPSGSGFDFLEKSLCSNFEIIFITAHNNYAVQAFKYSAIDYILKPIEIEDLIKAVERVTEIRKTSIDSRSKYNALFDNLKEIIPQKLVVIVNGQYEYIDLREVVYFRLQGKAVEVHLENGLFFTINDSFASIEVQLLERDFYRIHKDYMLNTLKVKKILRGCDKFVELINGERLPLNPSKSEDFIQKVSELNFKS
ncbi:MAG: DNA-binding response regulator [Bacteroidales bacterium]|nr:MAG: DNA-binding response regulator [Bacteroidales bacterium]